MSKTSLDDVIGVIADVTLFYVSKLTILKNALAKWAIRFCTVFQCPTIELYVKMCTVLLENIG